MDAEMRKRDESIILPDYYDEFLLSEFVPFPSVDYAVESVIETGSYIIAGVDREYFYSRIIERLQEEIKQGREW